MATAALNRRRYDDLVVASDRDFRVETRIYTDPEILEAEFERIFETTWVYVGHVSELESPGDFKTALVGRNPVIVSRAADGDLYVLLNECRHRGNAICRETSGTARNFECPYHGWTYALSGDLIGVTHPKGYPPDFAKQLGGLVRLRVATYRGLIFASLNDDAPSLEDHLGDVRAYIDLWADLSPEPEFRVTRPHLYAYAGNWKFQAENAVDGWHARFVHRSAFETVAEFGGPSTSTRSTVGHTRGFDHGFGILERTGIPYGLSAAQQQGYRGLLLRRHPADRVEAIWNVRHIFLFPNVVLFDNLIRIIQPVAVDDTVVMSYPIQARGVPDDYNQSRLHEAQARLSTSGMINTDDLEMFASNQTGMRGAKMRSIVLSHGLGQDQPVVGSEVVGEDTSELPQRSIYREWARLMGAGDAGMDR